MLIGRTDVEVETPILWPTDVKSWVIWKDPDVGKDWRQEEKGMTEDEMVGWHHWLDGQGFGWTPGVGDGQGGLACCGSWGCKESDTTERLNWTELNWTVLQWIITLVSVIVLWFIVVNRCCIFYSLKVCGNHVLSKYIEVIFPMTSVCVVSLSRFGNCCSISSFLIIRFAMVICDQWYYYFRLLEVQMMFRIF